MALAEAGWDVLGVDLAPTAVARARALWEEEGRGRGSAGGRAGKLSYREDDFFELTGTFDLIFDYTVSGWAGPCGTD